MSDGGLLLGAGARLGVVGVLIALLVLCIAWGISA